jgi:hypothetical protein
MPRDAAFWSSSGVRRESMDARRESEPTAPKSGTTVERKSERELVVTRTINGPARNDGGAVTTATFEEQAGKTLLVMHDLYPSKEALDAAIASGSICGMSETLDQLDELVVTLGASLGQS